MGTKSSSHNQREKMKDKKATLLKMPRKGKYINIADQLKGKSKKWQIKELVMEND